MKVNRKWRGWAVTTLNAGLYILSLMTSSVQASWPTLATAAIGVFAAWTQDDLQTATQELKDHHLQVAEKMKDDIIEAQKENLKAMFPQQLPRSLPPSAKVPRGSQGGSMNV